MLQSLCFALRLLCVTRSPLRPAVMIAAGFIGLLGEATLELAPVSTYPLGPFLAALGFLATMLADYAAHALSSGSHVSTCSSGRKSTGCLLG
jgi:hypothetical protein